MAQCFFSKFTLSFLIKIISQVIEIYFRRSQFQQENGSSCFNGQIEFMIMLFFDSGTQRHIIIMKGHEITQQLLNKPQDEILNRTPRSIKSYQQRSMKMLHRRFKRRLAELQPEKQDHQKRSFACSIVFSPQSKFIIGWQMLNIILMYIYFIKIPIILAFENHSFDNNEIMFKFLNTPAIIVFICDIFINLKTSFYQDGLLKEDPLEIRQHYFTSTFVWDIISLSAIFVYQVLEYTDQFQNGQLKIFIVLFYFRLIQLFKVQSTLNRSFDLNRRTKAFLKLILLLLKILLICNAVACSAFYISYTLAKSKYIKYQDGTNCTGPCYWVMNVTYADKSLYEYHDSFQIQYVYSLYWASTTMISIGYGDITPKNPKQVTFTVCVQYLSCLLYGYSINQIWSIIQQLNAKKNKIHNRLNIINTYLRDKGIGHQLTSKVNAYLNNYYISKNLRQKQIEAQIITELTPSLRKQVFYQSYSALFSQRYFERTKLTLIQSACMLVKQVGFYQGQMILTDKYPCLYYVKKGEIQNYIEECQRFLKRMYNGDIFGSFQFYTRLSFKSELKACVYSLLYLISVSDWREVLKEDDYQFERYYETRQEVMVYCDGSYIYYRCELCNSSSHRTEDCLDSQLRESIIDSLPWARSEQNIRKKYRRRQLRNISNQRHSKKVKRRHSNMVQGQRFRSQLSQQSKHNIFNMKQSMRKKSIIQEEKSQLASGKFQMKSKNNKQHVRALQKIRKIYTLRQIQDQQNASRYSDDAQFEQLNVDAVADYQFYYCRFNVKEQFRGELARRRIARRL